jgi:hypothetical protein
MVCGSQVGHTSSNSGGQKKFPRDMQARFRESLVKVDALEPRQQLALWASSGVIERLGSAWPDLPDELNDRLQDSWEPLLAIADEAGGAWPARARRAAVELAKVAEDAVPRGVELLADIREAFDGLTQIRTEALLKALIEKDPWGDWWGDAVEAGKLKSPAARLSRMLDDFGIKPKQLRIDGEKTRGYERADFAEAWERNLPTTPPPGDGTDGAVGTPQVTNGASDLQRTVRTVRTEVFGDSEKACPECGAWPHQGGHFAGCSMRGGAGPKLRGPKA